MVDMTRRLLVDAGITEGMHVLDVGCAHGDVTLLVAELVGPAGRVLGIDINERPLTLARARAAELGLSHVSFALADMATVSDAHGPFDAAVGRRVLMYQADAVAALRGLARALRPGGLVVFQEADATMVPASIPPLPLHQRVHEWMWRTVEREGGDLHMGFHLADVIERAGLQLQEVRAEAIVQTPDAPPRAGAIVRAMLSRIVAHGVATAEEIDVDTLDERLAAERAQARATYVGDMAFGAWARKPA